MSNRDSAVAALTAALEDTFDREDRVHLIGMAATALMEGRLPDTQSRLFLAGAILSWLELGGSLERDFLQVTKPKSRHTPSYLWCSSR